jgi:hypothetical protein
MEAGGFRRASGSGERVEVESEWKWRASGSGERVEVESEWKWRARGSLDGGCAGVSRAEVHWLSLEPSQGVLCLEVSERFGKG